MCNSHGPRTVSEDFHPWTPGLHRFLSLIEALLLLWSEMPVVQWQLVELFAGQGNVSRVFRHYGKSVASFDKVMGGDAMDFERPSGFASVTQNVLYPSKWSLPWLVCLGYAYGWSCAQEPLGVIMLWNLSEPYTLKKKYIYIYIYHVSFRKSTPVYYQKMQLHGISTFMVGPNPVHEFLSVRSWRPDTLRPTMFFLWTTKIPEYTCMYEFPSEQCMNNIPPGWPRLALILMVAEACHCVWIVEQPEGSMDVLPYHPRLDHFWNEVVYAPRLKDFNW